MSFKPMLAGTPDMGAGIRFPVLASPKIDGVRAAVKDGQLLSRSLKLIPNKMIQSLLGRPRFNGLDGELICGSPTSPNAMQNTTSGVMAHDKKPAFSYHVFDEWDFDGGFMDRLESAASAVRRAHENWDIIASTVLRLEGAPPEIMKCPIVLVKHELIKDIEALNAYEAKQISLGYEGIMVRDPAGKYKFGRSTVKEAGLLKVKRFTDGEFLITGFEEEQENTNEKTVNELGRSKRSTHKAGKVGKGTLGAFTGMQIVNVRSGGHVTSGPEFSVGTGMTAAFRKWVWENQAECLNKIGKFKHFDHGVIDAPRHPVWLGFRDKMDMS